MKMARAWIILGLLLLAITSWIVGTSMANNRNNEQPHRVSYPTNNRGERIPPRDVLQLHLIPRMEGASAVKF